MGPQVLKVESATKQLNIHVCVQLTHTCAMHAHECLHTASIPVTSARVQLTLLMHMLRHQLCHAFSSGPASFATHTLTALAGGGQESVLCFAGT